MWEYPDRCSQVHRFRRNGLQISPRKRPWHMRRFYRIWPALRVSVLRRLSSDRSNDPAQDSSSWHQGEVSSGVYPKTLQTAHFHLAPIGRGGWAMVLGGLNSWYRRHSVVKASSGELW